MSRATDLSTDSTGRAPITAAAPSPAAGASAAPSRKQCCPYCGATVSVETGGGVQPCPRCTMEDTPATRAATKSRIGPWYVLQSRNPAAPGMKWATLLTLVERGQVTARSVVRGPTTHQFWRFAAHVKGLSREFGLCYSCGLRIDKTAHQCPHCDRLQELPANPDALLETREPMIRQPVHREVPAEEASIPEFKPRAPKPLTTEFTLPPRVSAAPQGEIGHPPGESADASAGASAGWHPDPGILSARELAQAFQLDFNPQEAPRPRRRVFKSFVTVLLLAAIGFTGLMLLSTDLRLEMFAWAGRTRDAVQEYLANRSKKDAPAATAGVVAGGEVDLPRASAKNSAPATQPDAAPALVTNPPKQVDADIKPRPRQAIADPIPKPEVKEDPKASVPAAAEEDPVEQARALWIHAIDAEAKQDYPEAIKLYQQIKKLPPQAWPAGLEIRLAAARRQLE